MTNEEQDRILEPWMKDSKQRIIIFSDITRDDGSIVSATVERFYFEHSKLFIVRQINKKNVDLTSNDHLDVSNEVMKRLKKYDL